MELSQLRKRALVSISLKITEGEGIFSILFSGKDKDY